jgi:uncharacterized protein
MLHRPLLLSALHTALGRNPAAVLVGPRQVGKTTLARTLATSGGSWGRSAHGFDLEDPRSRAALAEPMLALEPLKGLVVIDEEPHAPEIFQGLRVLADRPSRPDWPARFLLLGSASPALLRQSSESMAGRVETIEAGGFTLEDTGAASAERLWWRGGFPLSSLAATEDNSRAWRREFIGTLVERDLLIFKDSQRIGVAFKRADAPSLTKSMQIALTDLALDALCVIYPGLLRYRLADKVEAVPLSALMG